ncbi:MAG TPA: glycosyltransferase family 87 protein [Candidatus Acidoferrales bacterium]|nr:glycosyltransferase family 87 protein [Candidatus Acidoferrales bacterium]
MNAPSGIGEKGSARKFFTKTNIALLLIGVLSLATYQFTVRLDVDDAGPFPLTILIQVVLFLAAAWVVAYGKSNRGVLFIIVGFAILFRFTVLFPAPQLSSDVYRYVWDGRVQAAGINPYRYIPAAPELEHLRDATIYPNINRAAYAPTIYPPAAQIIFLLATRISETVTCMKAVMMGFDLISFWLILQLIAAAGLPRERLLLFAWHPLVVWEFAGNGHVDAAMIFFVLLALWCRWRGKDGWTGVALGLAALVKLYPVVLFPALYRRWNWKMPAAMAATIVGGYSPYVRAGTRVLGFLPGYTKEEGLANGQRFFLLVAARRLFHAPGLPVAAFAAAAALAMLALAVRALWRTERAPASSLAPAFAIAATFTLLLSPEYTWYLSWLIPFTCFVPFFPVAVFTAAAFYMNQTPLQDPGGLRWGINLCLYIPFAIFSIFLLWKKRRTDGSAQETSLESETLAQ